MEKVIFKYVDLISLGTDEKNWDRASVEWGMATRSLNDCQPCSMRCYRKTEKIKNDFVGQIYLDLLYEAFIY